MGNLDYINELGISEDQATNDTEVEANDTEEIQEDLSLEPEENTSDNTETDTEGNSDLLKSLQKQIEGMEKRIADKDAYINELREASKQREAEKQQVDTQEVSEEDDFWDDPEGKYKALMNQMRIQQMQIQETVYANTVDDYWKTVNPEALKSAVATDADFANKFNSSNEPYKVAYEYLKDKSDKANKSQAELREQIKAELMKEMGVKEKKEVPPSISKSGGKSSTPVATDAPDDGFAAVFGSRY